MAALKFVPDWFATSKIIKKLFTALCTDENILYFNKDSRNVVFICNEMGILNIDINNVNLDDTNFDEDDPDTIILIRLWTWHIKFEKLKELKKMISEELTPVAWDPKRWWDWCVSEDEKKEIDPVFIEEMQKDVSVVYNIEVLKNFVEECAGSINWGLFGHFGVSEHFG